MDKKQKTLLVSILVILLLIVFLSGFTFAKYYTTYSANTSLGVAKWNLTVNDWTSETKAISLSNMTSKNEVNLADDKMAPGFKREYYINLNANDSDVDILYTIKATENVEARPKNLVFSAIIEEVRENADGTSQEKYTRETTTYQSLEELSNELTGVIRRSDSIKTRTVTIVAEWPFQTTTAFDENGQKVSSNSDLENQEDTKDGQKKSENYVMTFTVVGTQTKAATT